MGSLVLLHIGQAVVQVTTVDPVVLGPAAFALVASVAAIWLPRSAVRRLQSRRGRRDVWRAALTVIVFLALLPSVVPYDHLFSSDAHSSSEQDEVHVSHCHVSPGTCSDAPLTAGAGQLLLTDPLVMAPAMLAVLLIVLNLPLIGLSVRPEIRPPLLLSV